MDGHIDNQEDDSNFVHNPNFAHTMPVPDPRNAEALLVNVSQTDFAEKNQLPTRMETDDTQTNNPDVMKNTQDGQQVLTETQDDRRNMVANMNAELKEKKMIEAEWVLK